MYWFRLCFFLIEIYFTTGLLYCRVYGDFECHIVVENKHLFHFMPRLEVLLTIFIPIFTRDSYESLTRNTVAYFLLFDFFSDAYARFQGIWIKSALYLFVGTVTVTVATEQLHFNRHVHAYEEVSFITEVLSTFLCDTIIILQFFPFHFKTQRILGIARGKPRRPIELLLRCKLETSLLFRVLPINSLRRKRTFAQSQVVFASNCIDTIIHYLDYYT